MSSRTGYIQPSLDLDAFEENAKAFRQVPVFLNDSGSDYMNPTAFDYTNSTPLAVVLVEPTTGDPYTAAGGGIQDSYISTAVTLYALVNTSSVGLQESYVSTAATLYAIVNTVGGGVQESYVSTAATLYNIAGISVLPDIAGTVTANIGAPVSISSLPDVSGTVTANIGAPISVSSLPDIAGTVTANILGTAVVSGQVTADIGTFPDISGTVTSYLAPDTTARGTDRTAVDFRTRYVSVDFTASAISPTVAENAWWGVALNASPDNSEAIFIGTGLAVNCTADDTDSGVPLWPGDKLTLPLRNDTLYAVCPTTTNQLLGLVYLI